MVHRLAERNKLPVPANLLQGTEYQWRTDGTAAGALTGFLESYDGATSVIRAAHDYADVTYDYLKRSADEGCIYAELIISAEHAASVGLSYPDMLAAITDGYERAKEETGIEMRLISNCVRHYGPEAALRAAMMTRDNPHPLVTGFGMAGNENSYTAADFKPAFDICGLPFKNAHAGEAAGPESVRAVRDVLGVRRFGHMVRAWEDMALMEELRTINAVPEVCVGSNMSLKVFASYKEHPLRRFFDFGMKVTIGSDDPPFFGTSIGREYDIAHREFGFTESELSQITKNALEEAFIDDPMRGALLQRAGF